MRKLVIFSVLVLAASVAGCKDKENDGKDNEEKIYTIPTENATNIDEAGGKIVRTQVMKEGTAAAEITYNIQSLDYKGQTWKIYFTTAPKALAMGLAYQVYYAAQGGENAPAVTYAENVVTINYPLGTGPGDEKIKGFESLEAVQTIIESADFIAEILAIFGVV